MASKLSSLAVGGSYAASVMALATAGVVLMGGPRITDRNQASESCDQYGSGAYLCYNDAVLTNTGGKANYTSASIPCGTASCAIIRVEVDTEASPAGAAFDLGIVSSLTVSGSTVANSATTGSGLAVVRGTGSWLIPPGYSLKLAFGSTPGAVQGSLRVWYVKYFTP